MRRRAGDGRGATGCLRHRRALPLWVEVYQRWHRGWSPEEIAGSLKCDHPNLPLMHTFQESIYRYVYIIARGELQKG